MWSVVTDSSTDGLHGLDEGQVLAGSSPFHAHAHAHTSHLKHLISRVWLW